MSNIPSALSMDSLTRRFGGVQALESVSLDIHAGEWVGVIGPNGAGKSTLIKLLVGLLSVSSGHIRLFEQDVTLAPSHRRAQAGLGWTFQHARSFTQLTPREHICLASDTTMAKSWLQRLGLASLADEPISRLQFGDRKLLDFARAASRAPRVLLLDEPFAGLQGHEASLVHEQLAELRSSGITLLIVDHRLDELLRLVDRLVVLDRGCLIANGAPRTVLDQPEVVRAYFGVERV